MSPEVKSAFVTGVFSVITCILTYYLTSGSFEKKINKEYIPKASASSDSVRFKKELNKCKAENERLNASLGISINSENSSDTKISQGLQAKVLEINGDISEQKVEIVVKITNVIEVDQSVSVIDASSEIRSKNGDIFPAVHSKLANNEVDHFGGVSRPTQPLLIKPNKFLKAVYYFDKIPPSLTVTDEITLIINGNHFSFSNQSIKWK